MEVVNYEERYPTVVTAENTPHHVPVQNYEEQYPTVVDAQNTPHQFAQATAEESAPKYSAQPQFPVDYKKPWTPQKDAYPEVITSREIDPAYPNAIPPKDEVYQEPLGKAGEKRYCGLSKKAFLIAIVVLLVVIAGAVGGAIGGVLAGRNKKDTVVTSSSGAGSSGVNGTGTVTGASPTATNASGGSSSTGTGTAQPTSTASAATLDTTKSIGSLAVSSYQDSSKKVYMHLYYQQGANLAYRIYPGSGYFSTAQVLSVNIAPKAGTPLSAVEYGESGTNHLSLFYLDTYNNIILANYTSAATSTTLTLTKNIIAIANSTVHPQSQLAATYITSGYRLYYQTTSLTLQELVGMSGTWKSGASLNATAIAGSALTLAPRLNIFYVDSTTKSLFNINYGNTASGWSDASALSSASLTNFNGSNTALAAVSQSSPSYLRAYYLGTDSEVYEMLDPGADASWNKNADQSSKWPAADSNSVGGLAGVGWADQARLYYLSGGKIEQLDYDNGTWAVGNGLGGNGAARL